MPRPHSNYNPVSLDLAQTHTHTHTTCAPQIFLGGDPLLDLPGLLRYRISGDMGGRLKKLEAAGGPVVLRLVEHMVQRDAGQRKTVEVRWAIPNRESNFTFVHFWNEL